ncbi:MAG: hypothetical protein QM778_20150 [Myxococcales bacterium]
MATLKTSLSVTAQPTHISEQVGSVAPAESGLSVDPDDLGKQFLASAVEQSVNSEWPRELNEDDFPSDDGAALSDALELEAEAGSLKSWERALLRAMANGPTKRLARGLPPPPNTPRLAQTRPFNTGQGASHAWDEVDLTDEAIHEASLLDHEGPELGEAVAPSVLKTDDTHTHGKPRGGHLPTPRARRASPRAHNGKTLR